jgi:hypothetical protein
MVAVVRPVSVKECELTSAALLVAEPYAVVRPYDIFEVDNSFVVQVIVVVAVAVELAIADTIGAVLSTVTVMLDVARFKDESFATADKVCEPSVTDVLSQVVVYGETLIAAPMLAPSTLNCTFDSETLSEAVEVSVTAVPPTVAPLEGTVKETVGGVLSVTVVNVWSVDVEIFPKPSADTTAK